MAAQAKYLFVVMMDVAPEVEAAFNDVYDREHIPALLKVPGVRSAARYRTNVLFFVFNKKGRKFV